MKTFFTILIVISSIVVIVGSLLKESKADGLQAISADTNIAGHGSTNLKDQLVDRAVIIGSVVFIISSIVLAVS